MLFNKYVVIMSSTPMNSMVQPYINSNIMIINWFFIQLIRLGYFLQASNNTLIRIYNLSLYTQVFLIWLNNYQHTPHSYQYMFILI
jgi:hypothetical protein